MRVEFQDAAVSTLIDPFSRIWDSNSLFIALNPTNAELIEYFVKSDYFFPQIRDTPLFFNSQQSNDSTQTTVETYLKIILADQIKKKICGEHVVMPCQQKEI